MGQTAGYRTDNPVSCHLYPSAHYSSNLLMIQTTIGMPSLTAFLFTPFSYYVIKVLISSNLRKHQSQSHAILAHTRICFPQFLSQLCFWMEGKRLSGMHLKSQHI